MFFNRFFLVLLLLLPLTSVLAEDDKGYPLVYGCLGGSVVFAVAALGYAYSRPLEIDVDEVQRKAMTERKPPGFLQRCMEPREIGLTDAELHADTTQTENALA